MSCPLCINKYIQHYHSDKFREYWQCLKCDLVFVKPESRLNIDEEKAIYDLHQNESSDKGYRKFLNRLVVPLIQRIQHNSMGLDFGCGPGPTISVMLKELGYQIDDYDIFYYNNLELLNHHYDFITCTEVIEHFYNPHQEMNQLTQMLNDNGVLGIMTKRVENKEKFAKWHYKNDPTHVCFYSDKTFDYIAKYWGYDLEMINSDTIILTKC